MTRLIILLALAVGLAALVGWLQTDPGVVEIAWRGWRATTTVTALVVLALIGAAGLLLVDRVLVALGALFAGRRLSRARRGRAAVAQGLAALAAGEAAEARRRAAEARRKLGEDPLTLMLDAESAQAAGDAAAAAKVFDQMAERTDSAFLGVRGLLGQAVARGDSQEALELAERAAQLRPNAPWARRIILDLKTRSGDYAGARAALRDAAAARALPAGEVDRKRAALLVRQAELMRADGKWSDAMRLLRDAAKAAPDLPTLGERLAEAELRAGEPRAAVKTIERVFARAPSLALAPLYEEAKRKTPTLGTSGGGPVKRAKRLAGFNPNHPLAGVIVAAAALDDDDLVAARQAIGDAGEADAAESVWAVAYFDVMQRLAEAEDDADGARRALQTAAATPPPAPWACGECGLLSQRWTPICPRCGALDAAVRDLGEETAPDAAPGGALPALAS